MSNFKWEKVYILPIPLELRKQFDDIEDEEFNSRVINLIKSNISLLLIGEDIYDDSEYDDEDDYGLDIDELTYDYRLSVDDDFIDYDCSDFLEDLEGYQ